MTVIHKEYRIILPLTLEEYNISQLFIVSELTKASANGDTSITILENGPYEHEVFNKCQKTVKILNLNSKVPAIIRKIAPSKKALALKETAFNAFPRCNTSYVNLYFSESTFRMSVDSMHKEGDEMVENAVDMPEKIWKKTKIENLDIAKNIVDKRFNPAESDNKRTGRLEEGWVERCRANNIPLMVCYKHVTIEMNTFGLGWIAGEVEKQLKKLFLAAHQQLFCEMDKWIHLDIAKIREIEENTKRELEERNKKIETENEDNKEKEDK